MPRCEKHQKTRQHLARRKLIGVNVMNIQSNLLTHQCVKHILGNVLGSKKAEACAAALTLGGVKARTNNNRVSVSHGSPDCKQECSKRKEHQ